MAKLPKAQLLGEHGPDSQTSQVPPPKPAVAFGRRVGGRAHSVRCVRACGTERVRISLALRAPIHARARAPCSRARPGPTAPARLRRTTPLFCDGGAWPAFSGGPAALERARASLLSLSFNALDHSPDDLTVLIGELFLQV